MPNCCIAKPYSALSNLKKRVENIEKAGGISGDTTDTVVSDPNTTTENGFYQFTTSAVNLPTEYPYFNYGVMVVQRRYSLITQTIRYVNITAIRCSEDGGVTWSAWEYVNPPMALGVEYRTTERYNGKPVYAKLFDYGVLPNAASSYVSFNPSGSIDAVVYVTPVYYSASFNQYFTGSIGEVDQCYANSNGSLSIKTNADGSGLTATVLVKYTLK